MAAGFHGQNGYSVGHLLGTREAIPEELLAVPTV